MHEVEVSSSGIIVILNFMNITELVQKLIGEIHADSIVISRAYCSSLTEESRLKNDSREV
jgi:hypothetical protein